MKLSRRGLERYPKPVSPPMLLNDRRIHFSSGLWLWCHPSVWNHSLAALGSKQRAGRERADSSCLKSDMENVILLSQWMNLIRWYLPTQADTKTRILWGSMLSKHIRHHMKTHPKQLWFMLLSYDLATERKHLILTVIHVAARFYSRPLNIHWTHLFPKLNNWQ